MTSNQAYEKLREFCLTELKGKLSTGGWICIRGERICNECSRHKRSTLYMLVKEGSPVILNCFRAQCGMTKRVQMQDFMELGFTDVEAITLMLDEDNYENTTTYSTLTHNIIIRDTTLSAEQLAYFYKRTNIYPDPDDIRFYRLVPNVKEVMRESKILEVRQDINKMMENIDFYGKRLITFSNSEFNTFICRGAVPQNKCKLMFKTDEDKTNDMFSGYTLSRGKDFNTLVVTEGSFDLINVFTKFAIIENTFYVATLGFSHTLKLIQKYYRKSIDTMERLILFVDSDIKTESGYTYNKRMINKLLFNINKIIGKDAFREIYIVYNKASKDFGDMSEPIHPMKICVKGPVKEE